jgi:hypothetical protein
MITRRTGPDLDIHSPLQICLVGPPRSGKTLFLSHVKRLFTDNAPYAPTLEPQTATLVAQIVVESLSNTCHDKRLEALVTLREVPDSSDRDIAHHILSKSNACLVFADAGDADSIDLAFVACKRVRRAHSLLPISLIYSVPYASHRANLSLQAYLSLEA